MSFGEKLTKLRKEKGYSQEDLASKLNVSRQAVSKWESNSAYPETEKIVAICKLFNTSFDELIGLKENKQRKEEHLFLNKINYYFDFFINGIKMFYSMTFKQKIKCLIEMAFYALVLVIFFTIIICIFSEIFYSLFNIIPGNIVTSLHDTFIGLLILVLLITAIYILAKLYKVRYLDYYIDKEQDNDSEKIEFVANEKINLKTEKIIIRDANPDFNPLSWFKKLSILFWKVMAVFVLAPLAISFVLVLAMIIFLGYYLHKGAILIYILLISLGGLLLIYIFLEILIKFVFDMKQHPKRLFIMFIISLIAIGISSGLVLKELSTYKIIENKTYNEKIKEYNIPMKDNLIIAALDHYNVEIIFEDREDIYLEFYAVAKNLIDIYHYEQYIDGYQYEEFDMTYIYNQSFDEMLNNFLDNISKKEIVENNFDYRVKIYLSEDNYNKLKSNYIVFE